MKTSGGGDRQALSGGPTQGEFRDTSWKPRPFAAQSVAFALKGGPIVLSILAGLAAARLLPRATGVLWIAWIAAVIAASQVALVIGERLARRLLPLSTMLRFSLAFPDQAPSRMGAALRSGNSKRMQHDVREAMAKGLPADRQEALETALAMIAGLNRHDRGTRGHSEKVRAISEMLAEELGLSREDREKLRWGALLHDMGKLAVPSEILNKGGRPSEEEWQVLQQHPTEGERILAPLAEWLGDAVHAAGQHHERWDGKGYPRGLQGSDIALSARIVAVADAFAVMTSARAYKKPLPLALARQELTKNAGTQFDPTVVRAMLSVSVGRVSRTSGFLAPLANVPFLGPLIGGTASVPSVVGSGVTALLMTAGLAVPASPLEWANPFPIQPDEGPSIMALTDTEPTALASTPARSSGATAVSPTRPIASTPVNRPSVTTRLPKPVSEELVFASASSFTETGTPSTGLVSGSTNQPGSATPGPAEDSGPALTESAPDQSPGGLPVVIGGEPGGTAPPTTRVVGSTSSTTSIAASADTKPPRASTTTTTPATTTTIASSDTKPPRSTTTSTAPDTTTTTTNETKPPRHPPFATTTLTPTVSFPTIPPTTTTATVVPEKSTTTVDTTPPIIATTVYTSPPIIELPTTTNPDKKG